MFLRSGNKFFFFCVPAPLYGYACIWRGPANVGIQSVVNNGVISIIVQNSIQYIVLEIETEIVNINRKKADVP